MIRRKPVFASALGKNFIRCLSDRRIKQIQRDHRKRSRDPSSVFEGALTGKLRVDSRMSAQVFLSATLSRRDNPISVVEELVASQHGLENLHLAFNQDTGADYIDKTLQPVLSWLQYPALKSASNGLYLSRIIQALVEPPTSKFWNALYENVKYEIVSEQSMQCFAWLLLRLLTQSPKVRPSDMVIAKDTLLRRVLADSSDPTTCDLGQTIRRVCDERESGKAPRSFQAQHDNDFYDFREISTIPTIQELLTDDMSRLLRSVEFYDETSVPKRRRKYFESQYRLYRQDFLEEVKEAYHKAPSAEENQPDASTMTYKVELAGLSCEDASKKHGQHPWALKLKCLGGLTELQDLNHEERQKYIAEETDFILDQSLAVLRADGKPIAIVKVVREAALLANSIICIQIPNRKSTQEELFSMFNASTLEIVLLGVAGFAHEPVLNRLQKPTELPFEEELLHKGVHNRPKDSATLENEGIRNIVQKLASKSDFDLQEALGLREAVILDPSQTASLIASLKQRVGLVQGPPGTGKCDALFFSYENEDGQIAVHRTHYDAEISIDQAFDGVTIKRHNVFGIGAIDH